jgi:3-methyladenine DNA glycosylase Tag
MHVPEQVTPARLADYLEIMSKSVFQSGISWRVVESKWPGVREAMREFDPQTIAMLGEPELDELAQDSRMIRHRRKLSAISANAQRILELEEEHGSFEATLQSIRKEFKYMGDSGTYHFLWTVSEEVPPYEEWCATHERKRR